ncbi:arsenate reductase (glutaredoxin) [Psychromonas sp. Urea-02u-13]|uniref:arsenate reductase (glutaredoxin) n=1 Tax=Psychromonas sp. Urea-02u-13 TaxID=2058326 RepID=UPI000C33CF3F|nr:arsenate reductase (glutaredoxin) [Psychromonas sp. Urea-02u-13]PKG40311.1 arsenate reductase (glutaredoxin) [Psychromonas sp. Urea-02u-13]
MTDITILHNTHCSKSRQTLAIIEEMLTQDASNKLTIVNYLETPPTLVELKDIISLLGFTSARQLMRTGESIYKELQLKLEEDEALLLQAMLDNPKLIERPIVLANGKAKIGRPPESVLTII